MLAEQEEEGGGRGGRQDAQQGGQGRPGGGLLLAGGMVGQRMSKLLLLMNVGHKGAHSGGNARHAVNPDERAAIEEGSGVDRVGWPTARARGAREDEPAGASCVSA